MGTLQPLLTDPLLAFICKHAPFVTMYFNFASTSFEVRARGLATDDEYIPRCLYWSWECLNYILIT